MNEEEELTEEPVTDDEPTPKGLRAVIESQAAEISRLKEMYEADTGQLQEQAMSKAYADLDLSPDAGIGKALSIVYDGDASGLAEFAETEFAYVPQREHPFAQSIARGQAALDQAGQSAGSIAAPTQADTLAKAEAKGDYQTTLALKGQQLGAMLERNQRR